MANSWHAKQGQSVHSTITVSTGTQTQSTAAADGASSVRPHRTKPSHYCITEFCVHVCICVNVWEKQRDTEGASVCVYMAGCPRLLCMQLDGRFAALLVSSNMVNTPSGSNSLYRARKLCDGEWGVLDPACPRVWALLESRRMTVAALWLCSTPLSSNRCVLVIGQKLLSDISIAYTGCDVLSY